jgi:hypothetical protein
MVVGWFFMMPSKMNSWRAGGMNITAQAPLALMPHRRTVGNNQSLSSSSTLNAARTEAGEMNLE